MVDGKRSLAEGIFYEALDIVREKAGKDPIEVLELAMNNVMPVLEVKPLRRWSHLSGAGRGQS